MKQDISISEQAHNFESSKYALGFWIYLMTDVVLFSTLFATFSVLRNNTAGGPNASSLFDLNFVLIETLLLLTSSFTAGLALHFVKLNKIKMALRLLGLTSVMGLSFLILELTEFRHLISNGDSWQTSGFLSAFFTLVGTHGLHIFIGIIWAVMIGVKISYQGLRHRTFNQLSMFVLFWHFLDLIWIFIFSIVYLFGAL